MSPGPASPQLSKSPEASHAYMVVAGIRFDTSGRTAHNTRWQADMRSSSGYVARHPTGL